MAKIATKTTHWIWRITRAVLLGMILFTFVLPWAGGLLSYGVNWGGIEEQYWLDRVIDHLRMLRLDWSMRHSMIIRLMSDTAMCIP